MSQQESRKRQDFAPIRRHLSK